MKYTETMWALRAKDGRWVDGMGGHKKRLRFYMLSPLRKDWIPGPTDRIVRVTVTYEVEP